MSLLHRKSPAVRVTVYAEDGSELGFVFEQADRHSAHPTGWYAISHATGAQVGPGFDSQAEAVAALK